MKDTKLTWNVYLEDFNRKEIRVFDIFTHSSFLEDCRKAAREFCDDRDAFAERIRRELHYYFWSKCEYEIVLTSWPPREDFNAEKVDVCDQIMLNFDRFIEYLWCNLTELKRRPRRKKEVRSQ